MQCMLDVPGVSALSGQETGLKLSYIISIISTRLKVVCAMSIPLQTIFAVKALLIIEHRPIYPCSKKSSLWS